MELARRAWDRPYATSRVSACLIANSRSSVGEDPRCAMTRSRSSRARSRLLGAEQIHDRLRREHAPDDRPSLQRRLLRRRKPVDTGGEDGMDGVWHEKPAARSPSDQPSSPWMSTPESTSSPTSSSRKNGSPRRARPRGCAGRPEASLGVSRQADATPPRDAAGRARAVALRLPVPNRDGPRARVELWSEA